MWVDVEKLNLPENKLQIIKFGTRWQSAVIIAVLNNTIQSWVMKEKHGGRDCAFIETNLTTCLDWLRPELNARNCFVIQMIAALPACLVDCTCRHSLCARGLTSADMCHCLAEFRRSLLWRQQVSACIVNYPLMIIVDFHHLPQKLEFLQPHVNLTY